MRRDRRRQPDPATRVRTICPECGEVLVDAANVLAQVCLDLGEGTYSFPCPECEQLVVRDAEPRVVDALEAGGVPVHRYHLPAELSEAHSGPPLNWNDILDFHALLQQDDWQDALL